jgi:peroxiredoxin (alkyl hydroperoxide reductase subunit C)
MIGLGEKFPEFNKRSCVSIKPGKEFGVITSEDHKKAKQWMVMFWYPKDFTFICPTEIAEFDARNSEFKKRNAMLIAASTDTEYVHLGWRNAAPELKNLEIPMLADTSKSLGEALGILEAEQKFAYRATFIVDPEGTIQWISVNGLDQGRNVQEVLRVLDALQTGGLTPCNWQPGQKTL